MARYSDNPIPGFNLKWEANKRRCKCRGCDGPIENGSLKLRLCAGYQIGTLFICEECFLKTQEDYEEG